MLTLLLIWIILGGALTWLVSCGRGGSVGLPLAYFLGLSLIHVPGALLYLEGEELNSMALATRIGFEDTIIGMAAFLTGALIARYASVSLLPATSSWPAHARQVSSSEKLVPVYLVIGGICYFVILPVLGGVPSITAIVASLASLIIVGICLSFWIAIQARNRLRFAFTLALVPMFPLATLIQGGFISFGTFWALAIITFLFAQSKRRLGYIVAAPAIMFLGISVFVNYMAARDEIRKLVWYEQAGIGARINRIADAFREFEPFDLSNWNHRKAIDDRLNQNLFVGIAADRLESKQIEFASGATFGKMVQALIPRVLWPEKPVTGGGGTVVHDFTGITFAEGTSIGAGQVFEFYVNFGLSGVIGGFLVYGWLIGRLDLEAIDRLRKADQKGFLFFFMVGLALLPSGGNLVEIAAGTASAAIVALSIGYWLPRRESDSAGIGFPRATE